MKRKLICPLALLMVCFAVAGLAATAAEAPTVDRAGNAIQTPGTIERIISLAPSITQVVVDLGFGEKLVAVDTYSQGTEGMPADILMLDMMSPDMERMVALEPDIILASAMSLVEGSEALNTLRDAGICVAFIPSSDSIEGILEDTLFVGRVLGNEEGARALNGALQTMLDSYRTQTDTPVRVFFEIEFPYSFGSGTFLNEMIELLGGRNIFADQEGWISVSDEAVIAAAPEIIFTNADWSEDAVQMILARDGWQDIPAVANGQVYLIDSASSSQPNHRIILALVQMAVAMQQ